MSGDTEAGGPDLSMHELGEGQMTLAVAAVMPVVMGATLRLDDETMNAFAVRAIQIVFAARDGDPDQQALVLDCMERLQNGVRTILTATAATERPH